MVNQSFASGGVNCHPQLFPPMSMVSSIRFIAFIHIFSGAVAITGNVLVGLTICLNQQLQTFTNYFMLSLSVADGIVGCIGQPLMAYLLWTKGEKKCSFQKAQYFAGSASCGVSGLLLILVSLERYLHICKPFHYTRVMQGNRVTLVILTVTVGSMALTSVSFSGISRMAYSSILLGSYISALLCITPCYVLIYRTTIFHVRQVDRAASRAQLNQARISRRSTLTIFTVVLVFLACWAPFFITNCVWSFIRQPPNLLYTAYYYSLTLGYFNSCVNPFLYTYNNTALRNGILHTVVKIFGKRASKLCCIAEQDAVVREISIVPNTQHRDTKSCKGL